MEIKGISGLRLYTACGQDESLVIRDACPEDAEAIRACYRSIQFESEEVGAEQLRAFTKRGGMFRIPSPAEIASECEAGNKRFLCACRDNGVIDAVMRLDSDVSGYARWCGQDERILSYVELIVRSKIKRFSYFFLNGVFEALHQAGYHTLMFQIYHILSIEDGIARVPLGYDNQASIYLHRKLGAMKIGELDEIQLKYSGKVLHIRPDVYYLELWHALNKLKSICRTENGGILHDGKT